MRIYFVCPVRWCPPELKERLDAHVAGREAQGHEVYYPHRDTDQSAPEPDVIEHQRAAVEACDIVDVWWDVEISKGCLFDLGMAWMAKKPIFLVNQIELTDHPSYGNALLEMTGATIQPAENA